jgi:hypothetical protein
VSSLSHTMGLCTIWSGFLPPSGSISSPAARNHSAGNVDGNAGAGAYVVAYRRTIEANEDLNHDRNNSRFPLALLDVDLFTWTN